MSPGGALPPDHAERSARARVALGGIDTNCAIVGGIVALSAAQSGIPERWYELREDVPPG